MLLPQPVTVARARRRMIGGAIALDRQDELPRPFRVLRDQVDPVLGGAPLREDVDALRPQGVADILLEIVQRNLSPLATCQADPAFRGVSRNPRRSSTPFAFPASRIHVEVAERGDKVIRAPPE